MPGQSLQIRQLSFHTGKTLEIGKKHQQASLGDLLAQSHIKQFIIRLQETGTLVIQHFQDGIQMSPLPAGPDHIPNLIGKGHQSRLVTLQKCSIGRSEEHTSELQSLMRSSYAVYCLKKTNMTSTHITHY